MTNKQIEETYSQKIGNTHYHVTARNWNDHEFSVRYNSSALDVYHSVDGLRELAKYLIECADKIDADPDFKNQ